MANPFIVRPPSKEERSWVSNVNDRDWERDVMHVNTELKNMYALALNPPTSDKYTLRSVRDQLSALIFFVQKHMMGMDQVEFVGEIDPHFVRRV